VAPPLVKGSALLRRRIAGVVFLVVLALLVELSVALYQKRFTPTVDVVLEADRAGNQLSVHADVKVRGLVVGEVRRVRTNGERATLELALDPTKAVLVPRNVQAQLLPKTLFGEKEVALIVPSAPSSDHLREGDTIPQDRSSTAIETATALNDLLPLLRALEPQKVAMTLNALSAALRGRGDRLGSNLAVNAAYLMRLNPSLPTLAHDMQGLATLADNYSDATPNLLRTLDNLSASSRSLVEQRAALDTFLRSSNDFATSAKTLVRDNEQGLLALTRDSLPSLRLFASYSDTFPCFLSRVAFQEIEGERAFGGAQPGLHITVEVIRDNGGYVAGDGPKYLDTYNPHCYGLGPKPIIPFPAYRNPQDGYRDGAPPESPGTGPGSGSTAWMAPIALGPGQVAHLASMPRTTTPLEALLMVPVTGQGA
jgi:virulence factor Mce-like protein